MYDTGSPDDQTLDPVHEHEHSLDIESPGIFGRSYSTLDQDTTVGSPSSRTRSSPLDSRSSSSIRSNRSSSSSRRSSTLDRVSSTQKSLAESKQGTRGYYDRACSVGTDDMMGLLFHILELEDQLVGVAVITATASCRCLGCHFLPCPFHQHQAALSRAHPALLTPVSPRALHCH